MEDTHLLQIEEQTLCVAAQFGYDVLKWCIYDGLWQCRCCFFAKSAVTSPNKCLKLWNRVQFGDRWILCTWGCSAHKIAARYLLTFAKKVHGMVFWSKMHLSCHNSWSGQSGVYSLYSQDISEMIELYMLSSEPATFSNTTEVIWRAITRLYDDALVFEPRNNFQAFCPEHGKSSTCIRGHIYTFKQKKHLFNLKKVCDQSFKFLTHTKNAVHYVLWWVELGAKDMQKRHENYPPQDVVNSIFCMS